MERDLQRALCRPKRACGDEDPARLQLAEEDLEAVALGPHHAVCRDRRVLEAEDAVGRAVVAHHVGHRLDGEAGRAAGNHQRAEPATVAARPCAAADQVARGEVRIRDVVLGAVHDPAVALAPRMGADVHAAPGIGLGDGEGERLLARRQRRQKRLLLRLGAVGDDGARARVVDVQQHPDDARDLRELGEQRQVAGAGERDAAVFLGDDGAEQAQLPEPGEERLLRERAGAFHLARPGLDLAPEEVEHPLAIGLVVARRPDSVHHAVTPAAFACRFSARCYLSHKETTGMRAR